MTTINVIDESVPANFVVIQWEDKAVLWYKPF